MRSTTVHWVGLDVSVVHEHVGRVVLPLELGKPRLVIVLDVAQHLAPVVLLRTRHLGTVVFNHARALQPWDASLLTHTSTLLSTGR